MNYEKIKPTVYLKGRWTRILGLDQFRLQVRCVATHRILHQLLMFSEPIARRNCQLWINRNGYSLQDRYYGHAEPRRTSSNRR